MKVVLVLKYPNIDVIGDMDRDKFNGKPMMYNLNNVCACSHMGEHVNIIPFRACKDLEMNIDCNNVAMCFEADIKLGKIHTEEVEAFKKDPKPLLSRKEYNEQVKQQQQKVKKILKK